MNRACALMSIGVLMWVAACKPGTPSQYIQEDDMEDILVDYYKARAVAQQNKFPFNEREYNLALFTEAVLEKHGVTQAEFDSALVYYYTRADRFDPMMQRVVERLDKQALDMGASEGEIGKYAQLNATGDTANIWVDRSTTLLMPMPPYNRWEFSIPVDSSYKRGDDLMLMFMSEYMFQTGEKKGMAYMAMEYEDTVISRNVHFSISGLSQLRMVGEPKRDLRMIKGFFYLDGGFDPSTATRLLFLNNVQLIRFHTKSNEPEDEEIRLPRDSVGRRLAPDSISSRDSVRRGGAVVSPEGRAAVHPMAPRVN